MKIDHVTLVVSSLDRSMPYYEHLLPLLGFSKKGNRVWTDGSGFFFQFIQAKPGTTPYERYGAGKLVRTVAAIRDQKQAATA